MSNHLLLNKCQSPIKGDISSFARASYWAMRAATLSGEPGLPTGNRIRSSPPLNRESTFSIFALHVRRKALRLNLSTFSLRIGPYTPSARDGWRGIAMPTKHSKICCFASSMIAYFMAFSLVVLILACDSNIARGKKLERDSLAMIKTIWANCDFANLEFCTQIAVAAIRNQLTATFGDIFFDLILHVESVHLILLCFLYRHCSVKT
jgi:hypothetical protein